MALYLIGDVQGCDAALGRLLQRIEFSASKDTLYVLGDLVSQGQNQGSGATAHGLRRSAKCLLGNHDLSLLTWHRRRAPHATATWQVLLAPDRGELLSGCAGCAAIRAQPADGARRCCRNGTWCKRCAWQRKWKRCCAGPAGRFPAEMYGNEPAQWDDSLRARIGCASSSTH
jgi:bis(5'-nucleosyl)-tetraphosphatase (symmetrical)